MNEEDKSIDRTEVNEDEHPKLRIKGSNEAVEFTIGSSFCEDEMLYLKFKDEESLRQLRNFAEAHLWETDFDEVDE